MKHLREVDMDFREEIIHLRGVVNGLREVKKSCNVSIRSCHI